MRHFPSFRPTYFSPPFEPLPRTHPIPFEPFFLPRRAVEGIPPLPESPLDFEGVLESEGCGGDGFELSSGEIEGFVLREGVDAGFWFALGVSFGFSGAFGPVGGFVFGSEVSFGLSGAFGWSSGAGFRVDEGAGRRCSGIVSDSVGCLRFLRMFSQSSHVRVFEVLAPRPSPPQVSDAALRSRSPPRRFFWRAPWVC